MGARRKAFVMFGLASGSLILYSIMRGVGLKHMAERLSLQIIPNLAQVRADWQKLIIPVDIRIANRSAESVNVRINSVKLLDGTSEIADVAATTGATLHTLSPYSEKIVPLDIEVAAFGTLTISSVKGLFEVIRKSITAGREGSAKDGFVEFIGEAQKSLSEWMRRLSAVISIEAEGIPLSLPMKFVDGSKSVTVDKGKATVHGLGLVARTDRKILPLSDYEHLIPSKRLLQHKDPIVLYGTTGETAVLIRNIAKQHKWHTADLAKSLRSKDLDSTLSNIYHFVYNHIAYVRDSSQREQVRTPLRTLYDQKGDCDCYATLIASILENLKIPYRVRLAGYHNRDYFQHVYIVVPSREEKERGYYVIDPVVEGYNNEEPYTMVKDY